MPTSDRSSVVSDQDELEFHDAVQPANGDKNNNVESQTPVSKGKHVAKSAHSKAEISKATSSSPSRSSAERSSSPQSSSALSIDNTGDNTDDRSGNEHDRDNDNNNDNDNANANGSSSTIDSSNATPNQVKIVIHLRQGRPLVRLRTRKDSPPPVTMIYKCGEMDFKEFCDSLRPYTETVPGWYWPRDGKPYLQPAFWTVQARFEELKPSTFEQSLVKAWRRDVKRMFENTDQAVVNLHLYLKEENEDGSGRERYGSGNSKKSKSNFKRPKSTTNKFVAFVVPNQTTSTAVSSGTTTSSSAPLTIVPTPARPTPTPTPAPAPAPVPTVVLAPIPTSTPALVAAPATREPTATTTATATESRSSSSSSSLSAGGADFRTIRVRINGAVVNMEISMQDIRQALFLNSTLVGESTDDDGEGAPNVKRRKH
ncbi:hypothetical protein BGZ94_003390 [Podila epigama]|nr:hypothetical protein BGZ94_003390 [Podila epigama]